jgi:hypothetical protein
VTATTSNIEFNIRSTYMSSLSNAVENNNRLFPPFARKLAENDTTVYATFAHRLAVWLGSERAYYPAARPEVSLLPMTCPPAF